MQVACRHAQRLKQYGIKLGAPRASHQDSHTPSRSPRASDVRARHFCAASATDQYGAARHKSGSLLDTGELHTAACTLCSDDIGTMTRPLHMTPCPLVVPAGQLLPAASEGQPVAVLHLEPAAPAFALAARDPSQLAFD